VKAHDTRQSARNGICRPGRAASQQFPHPAGRDVDARPGPGAKVGSSAPAPSRGFGAAPECQDRRRPDNAWRRRHHARVV